MAPSREYENCNMRMIRITNYLTNKKKIIFYKGTEKLTLILHSVAVINILLLLFSFEILIKPLIQYIHVVLIDFKQNLRQNKYESLDNLP